MPLTNHLLAVVTGHFITGRFITGPLNTALLSRGSFITRTFYHTDSLSHRQFITQTVYHTGILSRGHFNTNHFITGQFITNIPNNNEHLKKMKLNKSFENVSLEWKDYMQVT